MKFACDNCQTRYVIPDERVLGKILRVRCKRCRDVIEVVGPTRNATKVEKIGAFQKGRDTAQDRPLFSARRPVDPFSAVTGSGTWGAAPSGTHGSSSSGSGLQRARSTTRFTPVPPPDPGACWYLAMKGEARGPFSIGEVDTLARRGRIHSKTRAWCVGMAVWERLKDIPALAMIPVDAKLSSLPPPGPELTPAAGSGLLAEPEMGPITPKGKPFSNLMQSQPPPPLADQLSGEHTPAPTVSTGGTGWYILDDRDVEKMWDAPELPHVAGTSPLVTGSHLIRRRSYRVAVAVVGISMLAVILAALALFPLFMPDSSQFVAPAPRPVTPRAQVAPDDRKETVEKIRSLGIPSAGPSAAPAAVEAAPVQAGATTSQPVGAKAFEEKLSQQAAKMLSQPAAGYEAAEPTVDAPVQPAQNAAAPQAAPVEATQQAAPATVVPAPVVEPAAPVAVPAVEAPAAPAP